MTQQAIQPGMRGIVTKLSGHGHVRRRLMDMGIIPGTEIEIQKVAPLGDPVEIKCKGYNLSLRWSEAAMIDVEMKPMPLSPQNPTRKRWIFGAVKRA